MSRTISGSTTGPVVLGTADNPLYVTSTGTVTSSGSSDGVDGGSSVSTWTINNAGKIAASGRDGVSLASSGTITNTGSISGVDAVVLASGGSVANNAGTISSLGTLGGGSGSGAGVNITGAAGTVTNHAAIAGVAYGISLGKGGLVTNTSSITGGEDSIIVQGGAGTIVNSGTLIATVDDGIGLFSGGSVTNTSGASISGSHGGAGIYITGAAGTVTNAGTISGGYHGLFITNGGSISNAASGFITGTHNGIVFKNQAGTITNSGTISGGSSGGTGVYLKANSGANVTNTSTGTISAAYGIFATSGGTVTNAGRISGSSYAVDFTASATNRLVVDPGAVFVGKVKANSGGTNTLELAGSGTGSISGVGTSFINFQTLAVDAGATWTLTGANSAPTVLNNGTLNIASSLTASTALNPASTGLFQLQTGGTLEFAAATGTNTQVNFLGNSVLTVDNFTSFGTNVGTSSYAGTLIEDFVNGDKIDLKNFSSSGVTFSYNASTGLLQLSNSSSQHASLEFQTSSLGSTGFQASSDGGSGIFITTSAGSPPPPPPAAPTITAPANGSTITTTADPTISGSGISGDTVTVSIDGTVAGSTTVASGTWSYTPTTPLSNASHSVTATQAAAGGPSSAPSTADSFTINVPTPAPTITAPANGSTITTTADPTISGSGISGDTVTVSIDGTVAGSTTVASGTWSYTPTTPLSNASHSVTATQAAAGGPSSAPSTADSFTINVPTPAPTITAPANGSTITTTADPTISGSGISGDTVTVSIDGTVAGSTTVASGTWSYTPTTPLSNASHSVTATQAAAGGPSSAPSTADSFTINVPTPAPTITAPANGSTITTTADPTISGSGISGDTVTVSIDGTVAGSTTVASGTWSYTPTTPLSNASHSVTATQAAAGGPSSAPSTADSFTINVPTPAPTITAPANGSTITTTADPTISGSGISGDTVTVSIDGTVAGSTTVASGTWSYTPTTPLSNASHSVTATQAAAGGPSSAPSTADSFTINVPTPAPTITAPANGSTITTTADPTISGSGISGDTVTVSIDGTVAGSTTVASGTWSYTPTTPLSNASHSVTATQAAAGGPSSAPSTADSFTINVPTPAPTITAPANGSTITTTADPTISGSGISGDTVTVSIDGTVAGSTTVASGTWSYTPTTPLSNASHSVTATQAAAGGPSSAPSTADSFTINVPTPAPTITAPANGSTITTTADPTISGSGISGDTVTVSIDGTVAGSTTVASGTWSYTPTTPLSNASHSVTATQAAAGGPSSAPSTADSFTINVPTPAPTITAPANGSTITTTADPTISGSGISGDTVTVSIDGTVAGSTTVASGTWSYTPTTPLSNASHSVTATQAAAGGPSSAPSTADSFTINVPTPAPTITAPANGSTITTTADPTISGSGISGDTVTVSIDGTVAGSTTVASGTWSYTPTTPLSNASHSVTATQAAAGGPSSAPSTADSFTINVPTPAPTITAPANGSTITTTADPTISGSGISGDTVTVSIDGTVAGSTTVASGTWSYTPTTPLSNASHSVTATQAAAGGPSSAPSTADSFTINVPTPAPTITAPANGSTITTTADPTISGSGISGDTVTVSIDGTVAGSTTVASGTWSYTPTTPLSNASHSVTATQAAAGGPSSAPSTADSFTINVPTPAPTITAPANGSTITTTADPTISGSGISGDTVTVSIDGTVAGSTTVASGTWSYTPTTPLSNASHSVTATQAAAGGPSSAPSTADSFTINVPTAAGSTISTSTTGPVVLSAASNPLYVTSTGAVTSTGSGVNGINGGTTTAWTITNAGKISSSAGNGVSLASRSVISNTGSISGSDALVLKAGGTVTNASSGSISSLANGAGVYIAGAAGTVTNAGSISGVYHGLFITGGGSVSNATSGAITGQHNGIVFKNQAGTVTNSGNISGTGTSGTGVYLQNNGVITNKSTGIITGHVFGAFIEGGSGAVANYGSISSATDDGVVLGMGGTVTNAAGASISGPSTGVYVKYRAAGTVTNSGGISANAAGGAGVDLADGGSITNNSTGSISGNSFGVFVSGAAGTVTNAGTISGGSYAVDFTASATNRLILDPGAVFVGNVTANSSGTNTLELAGGSGAGSIGAVGTTFKHFQTLAIDAGATWTLTSANTMATVLDNGTLSIAGSLVVSSAINPASTGLFQIQAGATLEAAADTGTQTQINFLGSSQLIIDNVTSFGTNVGTSSYAGPLLENFVNADKIDLKQFSSTGVSFSYNASTGVLQLSNGSSQHASLDFQASSLGSASFQFSSDGAGGTFVTTAADNDGSPEPPALTIANTSLTVTAGGSVSLGVTATPADSDDAVSVSISGVPSYETISAPGDTVVHQAGSGTWTISSTAGVPIIGLTLTSNYTGTGQPVAALSVTASNTTMGETASSASQTLNVTDPPSVTSATLPNSTSTGAPVSHIAALLNQFMAAGFHNDHGAVQVASLSPTHPSAEDLAFLAHPHH